MNYLAIDFGTKKIGIAVSIMGIISPLDPINNDNHMFFKIKSLIQENNVKKIYVGMSEGAMVSKTRRFVKRLSFVLQLPVETVEEAVSTIEATEIFLKNKRKKKEIENSIDSIAAAVILRRVLEN